MKKLMATIFLIVVVIGSAICESRPKSLTLFVYMNGSNLESRNRLATADIKEMISSTPADTQTDFTILLLMGGTKQWHTEEAQLIPIQSDSITYAKVTEQGLVKLYTVKDIGIGVPETLERFIRYGKEEYPAERYGLIFWNHGAGSVNGFGYDELHTDDPSLSIKEIQDGLRTSYSCDPQKFDFIGFDACLMATLETAHSLAPYAEYMIASQELEPGGGWDYRQVISTLDPDSDISAEDAYRTIAESFISNYAENVGEQVTLSVIRLDRINALSSSVEDFIKGKKEKLSGGLGRINTDYYQTLSTARARTKSFGMPAFTFYGPDMVDVMDLCQNLADEKDDESLANIRACLSDAVVCNTISSNLKEENICGLSIYFPYYNTQTANKLDEYYQSGFNEGYLDFVRGYTKELLSGNNGKGLITVFDEKGPTEKLSTDMILNTRKIYSIVLRKTAECKRISYGLDGEGVVLSDEGRILKLNAKGDTINGWDKKWISIGGKTVSAYMSLSDKTALSYTVPVYLNGELSDLIVGYDEKNPSGKVYGARRIFNEQIPDKGITPIQKDDKIVFLHKEFYENDSIDASYIASDSIVATKKKHLKVNLSVLPKGEYQYGYCLIDLYGKRHYTPFKDYKIE